jgi:hypothetical protein
VTLLTGTASRLDRLDKGSEYRDQASTIHNVLSGLMLHSLFDIPNCLPIASSFLPCASTSVLFRNLVDVVRHRMFEFSCFTGSYFAFLEADCNKRLGFDLDMTFPLMSA